MSAPIFDIVILVGPNETPNIALQLEYTKRNVRGYRNIYLVTHDPAIKVAGCITIPETEFPFSIADVAAVFAPKSNRNGWYLQQLLKLYAGFVIPNIAENYLVIDADVFFLEPMEFFTDDGRPLYTTSDEYWRPYFDHMERLHPKFERASHLSGISHHMMFQKKYVAEIFHLVENSTRVPFWRTFLTAVDEHRRHDISYLESGASEYELYFHYMTKFHGDKIVERRLHWRNISAARYAPALARGEKFPFNYVSLCWYM